MSEQQQLFLGLIRLIGPPENPILDGCKGAYVNVVALATNEKEFVRIVTAETKEFGLTIDSVKWIELMSDRLKKFDIEDYLLDLAKEAEEEKSCRFGVFHAWGEDD